MAELATVTRSKVAQVAARKMDPSAQNRRRSVVIDSAPTYTAANGDTFGTGIIIPKGSRLLGNVLLSNAAGAASSTLALGLRDPVTLVAVDATAIIAATAITTATTATVNTGTKITAGQFYLLPSDLEIYGTFAGATPTANQAIRAEIDFIAP